MRIILIISSLLLLVFMSCNNTSKDLNYPDERGMNRASVRENSTTIALFDRWEKVWREGQYALISTCVADTYIRHDMKGDRILTRKEYANEIMETRKLLPDIKFIVYDNSFGKNEAWLRYTMTYTNPETNKPIFRKGIQVYRREGGKLAETWMTMLEPGTQWTDSTALNCWSCSE